MIFIMKFCKFRWKYANKRSFAISRQYPVFEMSIGVMANLCTMEPLLRGHLL